MKVLIIDDDPEIVETVSLILKIRWPECDILSKSKGEPGLELVEAESPDMVILDLGLPDMSGFDVLKQMRSFSSIPVIILTVWGDRANIVKGLELGADDYLVKPFDHLELLARAQAVLRRMHCGIDDDSITVGGLHFGPSFGRLNFEGREVTLTNTECLVLYQLMKNAGTVLNYTMLAEKIWGDYYPSVVNIIRVYIRRLRKKLETDPNHPQLILTKVGVGYFLKKPS